VEISKEMVKRISEDLIPSIKEYHKAFMRENNEAEQAVTMDIALENFQIEFEKKREKFYKSKFEISATHFWENIVIAKLSTIGVIGGIDLLSKIHDFKSS